METSVNSRTNLKKLMETNKNISIIRDLAFQIKIKSLNEQILAIRNDLEETGFQVVSREFIGFSRVFEELADEMQALMDEMLIEIARELKVMKKQTHIELAEKISGRKLSYPSPTTSFQESTGSFDFKIPNGIKLKKFINKASLLSLKGNNIFVQSKITGAYIKNNGKQSLLNTLISELGEIMENVRVNITTIKKIWS